MPVARRNLARPAPCRTNPQMPPSKLFPGPGPPPNSRCAILKMKCPPQVPTIAMLKTLAPRESNPPSANIRHCTISTHVITMMAALGPRSTAESTPPIRCPEVPPVMGKFTICAAKTKAAERPRKGIRRGTSCVRVRRTASAMPAAAAPPESSAVLASRKPSGRCMITSPKSGLTLGPNGRRRNNRVTN